MVRNLEHLKQSAPSPFLLDLVETAWSWRGQEQAISKRPRSGVVNTITEVAPDPAIPSASQPVYWPKILSRPKILVDIGEQAPETGIGGLARESTGWVFKDFATKDDLSSAINTIVTIGTPLHNSLPGRSDADAHPFSALTGILLSAQFPELTGDVDNTALATTVIGIGGFSIPTLGATAGFLRWSGTGWVLDSGSSGGIAHNDLSGRSDPSCHPFTALSGILQASQFPSLTGDVSNTALATQVIGLRGSLLPLLGAAGNLRWTGSIWTMDPATYAEVSALGSYVLKAGDTMSGPLAITLSSPASALNIHGSLGAAISMSTTGSGLNSEIGMNTATAAWVFGAMNSSSVLIPVGAFALRGPSKAYFWQTTSLFSHRTSVETTGSFTAQLEITSSGSGIFAPIGRVSSYWASFTVLASGGMVKASASTGELGLASESDLPGGPFLHASGGSTNKIAKWLSATSLGYGIASDDGSTFSVAGNGDFTGRVNGGAAKLGTWSKNTDFAWFGHKDQAGYSYGNSGFLQDFLGNIAVCARSFRSIALQYYDTNRIVIDGYGVTIPYLASGGIVEAEPGTGLLVLVGASGLRKYLDMPDSQLVFGSTAFGISSSPRARFYNDEIHLDNEARIRFHSAADFGRGGNIRAKYNSARASAELVIESGSQSDGNGGVRIDVNDGIDITPVATFEGGGVDYEGPCSIFHENAYFKKNVNIGSMRNRVPHIYTDSSTLPVLGVNEWCFLVCDDPAPTNLRWRTNSTQDIRVRSGGTTYTTAAGGNIVSDSAAINVNYVTCILIGPTRSDSNICSFIPF